MWIAYSFVSRWVDGEHVRLVKLRLALLKKAVDEYEKALANRKEAWEILQKMEPDLAEQTWKIIKGMVVSRQWPKTKPPAGGN